MGEDGFKAECVIELGESLDGFSRLGLVVDASIRESPDSPRVVTGSIGGTCKAVPSACALGSSAVVDMSHDTVTGVNVRGSRWL